MAASDRRGVNIDDQPTWSRRFHASMPSSAPTGCRCHVAGAWAVQAGYRRPGAHWDSRRSWPDRLVFRQCSSSGSWTRGTGTTCWLRRRGAGQRSYLRTQRSRSNDLDNRAQSAFRGDRARRAHAMREAICRSTSMAGVSRDDGDWSSRRLPRWAADRVALTVMAQTAGELRARPGDTATIFEGHAVRGSEGLGLA